MSFYIPIYKIKKVDSELQFCAYLNAKFVNVNYPERRELLDKINQVLNIEMNDPDYSVDALKLMYAHYSDGQYYLWNRKTQVSFEQKIPKSLAEAMIASVPHFTISVEVSVDSPDIFWEAS